MIFIAEIGLNHNGNFDLMIRFFKYLLETILFLNGE